MRWIVYGLAALVALKFYTEDAFYRTGTSEALIDVYRTKALAACESNKSNPIAAKVPGMWSKPREVTIQIGRNDPTVGLWDIDNPEWKADYKQPYLVVEPADRHSTFVCKYDIVTGVSKVFQRG
ncbi:MAG: hypothetical protein AAFV45_10525 [Pseudomonadota bacterium]